MPDQPGRPGEEINRGHPSAQLRAAPNPGDEPPAAGPLAFPAEHDPPRDVVSYGPDIADETTLRLLPGVEGKRVLELGAGGGHNAVALARQGAHVIVARGPSSMADARAIFAAIATACGGRGGGRPERAEGRMPGSADVRAAIAGALGRT